MTFHLMCFHIILVRFGLLSGHLLGNSCSFGLPYVLFCILNICNISYFPFLFWVLIASVLDLCILLTFVKNSVELFAFTVLYREKNACVFFLCNS